MTYLRRSNTNTFPLGRPCIRLLRPCLAAGCGKVSAAPQGIGGLHLHIYRLRGRLGLVGLAVLRLSAVWLLVATLVRLLGLLRIVAALLARGRSCTPEMSRALVALSLSVRTLRGVVLLLAAAAVVVFVGHESSGVRWMGRERHATALPAAYNRPHT